jgi:phosphate transport system permease protein
MNRFWRSGDPFIWLTGGALAACLLMIAGLVTVVVVNGLGFFWPTGLLSVELDDGSRVMGQLWDRQEIPAPGSSEAVRHRIQLKVGNRDVYGMDFRWVDEDRIQARSHPREAVILERREWGQYFGFPVAAYRDQEELARGHEETWTRLTRQIEEVRGDLDRIREIEHGVMGKLNRRLEKLRLEKRRLELARAGGEEIREVDRRTREYWAQYDRVATELTQLREEAARNTVALETADGRTKRVAVAGIVRAYRPNEMGWLAKTGLYAVRAWEFFAEEPRESNTEGGVFPAIFGTVMMVILMSLAAVPFGVIAAIYLREYAKQGPMVRAIRIAVNNLAGVPSIVFGMFGLGFFVYGVGGTIDHLLYNEALPTPTFGTGGILWASLTLALLTVPVMIVSAEEALAAVPSEVREGSLALGATQFQTIWRVVLPGALPGILTGIVMVIARGAGEVAPLMITGVVKLAPTLPVDGHWPFFHLERKFMHLGFHIYDVGFQSPNVEAARPMVYTTTLLLMMIVLALNLTAIRIRNTLRKRYQKSGL